MEQSMTMTSGIGTPFYMAPEMVLSSKHYTAAVDVYSFAIMAAQVMVGRLKYDHGGEFETQYGLLQKHPLTFLVSDLFTGFCFLGTHSVCERSLPEGTPP